MITKLITLIILIGIAPIIAMVSIVIIIDDGLPIFFRQKRVGKNNSLFDIYKFRTMKKDTPDLATHLIDKSASLYTVSGPFLRKYSIDEIPQLFNVLKADMGFIGPRPALYNQENLIKLRTQVGVHSLIPGITGWAQVNGRDEIGINKKVEMDLYYKENRSVFLDIRILILTIKKVFKSEGVSV